MTLMNTCLFGITQLQAHCYILVINVKDMDQRQSNKYLIIKLLFFAQSRNIAISHLRDVDYKTGIGYLQAKKIDV